MPPREHINTVPSSCFKIADNALGGLAAAMWLARRQSYRHEYGTLRYLGHVAQYNLVCDRRVKHSAT
jgi:hypothetical protein